MQDNNFKIDRHSLKTAISRVETDKIVTRGYNQRDLIEKTAQGILDARSLYPDSSLADLYDEVLMPLELRKAHRANDKAVMQAYGFWGKLNSESECVAKLMKMYERLTVESKR